MSPRPDLLILITDQERYPQHWPAGLREVLMPSWTRLERHGLPSAAPIARLHSALQAAL